MSVTDRTIRPRCPIGAGGVEYATVGARIHTVASGPRSESPRVSLYLAGAQLGSGVSRSGGSLSAERFRCHRRMAARDAGSRMYRTGDVVSGGIVRTASSDYVERSRLPGQDPWLPHRAR